MYSYEWDLETGGYLLNSSQLQFSKEPIPENDIWIVAIAKENDMVIVTRDKHLKTHHALS